MKFPTYHIAIHDLLSMRIDDRVGWTDRILMRPMRGYQHHAHSSPAPGVPDVYVRIGPFAWTPRKDRLVDRRFHVADNYFACQDQSKLLSWQAEIEGFSCGPTYMRLQANTLGSAALGSRLIDCMVRYRLAQRDAVPIHGCGIVGRSGACLLSGRSGVGKSTLAMQLLSRGYQLLGDNWVIVHDGWAKGFHLPLNIHAYNVAPIVRARLTRGMRWTLRAWTLARQLSGGFLKKAVPLVLRDFFPEAVAERGPLEKVLTFSQGEQLSIQPMPRAVGLSRLVANDMTDREAFHRYQWAYAAAYPESPVAKHWLTLADRLDRAIPSHVPFYNVIVPRHITPEIVGAIEELIEQPCPSPAVAITTYTAA